MNMISQAVVFAGDIKEAEAWHAAIHGVAKSQTQLSDWTELTEVGFYVVVQMAASCWLLQHGTTFPSNKGFLQSINQKIASLVATHDSSPEVNLWV